MSVETQQLLKFGAFILRADESVLERDGNAVPLTPKMYDMLLVLVRNPGRIVEKDMLLREVWPDSFVEEGNIAFNIRQLRKLLGCDAQSPVFIETVPRRGYRFIAPVEPASPAGPAASPDPMIETFVESTAASRWPKKAIGSASLIVVLALIAAGYTWRNLTATAPGLLASSLSIEKLSADGNIYHAVLSGDGKNLVYTHRNGSGKQSLWVRDLNTSNSVQIVAPSDHFYGGMALSPDGETIYFARGSQTGPQTDIFRMPIAGGVPEKVIESTQGWMSLSPDGSRISFVRCPYTEDEHCSLYIADTDKGLNEKKLVTRPKFIRISDNRISPDGKKIAFASGHSRTASNEFGLYEVDIESGVERPLSNEKFFNIGYLTYLPGQESVLMTAMQRPDRSYPIWRVSVADGKTERLTTDSECYSRLSIDKQASILLATRVTPDFRLYLHSLENPGTSVPIASAGTVTFASNDRLIFSSEMSGNSEIWSAKTDGTDQRQLTNDPATEVEPIVSPDGSEIFFGSDRTGVLQLWRMNIDGSEPRQLTRQDGGYPLVISPDGRWIFYRSAMNGTIRKVELETGQEEVVSTDLGRKMTISPKSDLIAFAKREKDAVSLHIYSITDARVIRSFNIDTPRARVAQIAWSKDANQLNYILTDDKKENGKLFSQPISGGPAKEIADLRGDSIAEMTALALSPDGKSFAVIKGNWKHDAVLIRGLK
jgi:Tol biopolymer transport system component/DNA-binding winged helix-turn-helix (wHTH) protein